jgi:CHAD domain-containing protein
MPKSGPHAQPTAADVLAPVWRHQAEGLRARETDLRSGRELSVHDFRIAARRLRSNLAAFGPLLEGTLPKELTADLRETALKVSGARDSEMLSDRVGRLLAEEPDAVDVTRVRSILLELLDSTARANTVLALTYFDDPAYDAFVRRLDRFSDLPPWASAASEPAAPVLRDLLRDEWKRFRRAGTAALAAPRDEAGDALLHTARKAAKRARYVTETLVPVFGRRASRMAKAAAQVQQLLGEHQDSAVTRDYLAGPALEAISDADDRFVLGRLHAREEATSEKLRDDYSRLFLAADRKALRRWL